jgi:ATP-binding cassette subfamily F protein 3
VSIVTISNGRIGFGDIILVEGISAVVHPGQRIGLVGANGTGKTTLLRVIGGEHKLDFGRVDIKRGLKFGFLRQTTHDIAEFESRTLYAEMEEAMHELDELSARVSEYSTLLAGPGLDDATRANLIGKLGGAQHRFEVMGGFDRDLRIRRVLSGLGFAESQFDQPLATMSGGQRQKAMLARLLFEQPDLLLLDEPNNHLDLEGRRFLEEFLVGAPCAIVVVSHDRYFLNRVAQYIWEIDREKLFAYRGNYDAFRKRRLERIERQRADYAAQQEYIKRTEEYIRRNIAGQNTRQARGRRKLLARLGRVESVRDAKTLKLDLKDAARTGLDVVRAENLAHKFDDGDWLFHNMSLSVERGSKVGVIGPNGCGKTTLLTILARKLKPAFGRVEYGANVRIAYLTQETLELNDALSVLDEFRRTAQELDNPGLRSVLAAYLFCGDDVFKIVGDLSGGEKRRLAFAKLLYARPNLLLLDEPTNHFDLPSYEMIESALGEFRGTVVMVSHDRMLLDAVATHVIAFTNDGVVMCDGNYSDLLDAAHGDAPGVKVIAIEGKSAGAMRDDVVCARDERDESRDARGADVDARIARAMTAASRIELYRGGEDADEPAKKKRRSNELERKKKIEKLEKRLAEVECEIEKTEARYHALVARMNDPSVASDYVKLSEITREFESCEADIAKLYEQIDAIVSEMDEA